MCRDSNKSRNQRIPFRVRHRAVQPLEVRDFASRKNHQHSTTFEVIQRLAEAAAIGCDCFAARDRINGNHHGAHFRDGCENAIRKHADAKPLTGIGGGVLEVVEDFDKNSCRAVYMVRFGGVVYVLHVFQKKSKSGKATPKPDVDLIKSRLKLAKQDYERRTKAKGKA